jgi:CRISPR-associated endonuclease/helicase Cas3
MTEYHAHTLEGRPAAEWQPLREHLIGVADLAAEFAEPFGAQKWARAAGLWHDLGKFAEAFQSYLRRGSSQDLHDAERRGRIDHSTAGAQHAVGAVEILGHLLAYAIAGHHSGLLDGRSDGACLEARLRKQVDSSSHGLSQLPRPGSLELPGFLRAALGHKDGAFAISFFVRMVFSCLVDADFLDTERFMRPERAAARPIWPDHILQTMMAALSEHAECLEKEADDTSVNRQREAVRQACLNAAEREPGLFSLTVPTGGGKTLSSLAFALGHAVRYGLRRVVYVIPFTSIIEQNADVFRRVMAPLVEADLPDPVLEHHSNLDVGKETLTSRLAAEDWDAPLVVTTSVQLYESLFANRTSRCRKLHNIARSVIILDEAQTLPVDFLNPCLRVLHELCESYGASVVLCTATQPAVHRRDGFSIGLEGVREIIPDPQKLYLSLQRVEVEDIGKQDDALLGDRLRREEQVLCIVNTRSHARKLFEELGDQEEHFHLSALMCPEHRSQVLRAIRESLEARGACRVVSTQLIEAGVDIDFPVVYRSLAGLDAVAQAAGRCNRNARLRGRGRTFVFRSEHTRSESFFRDTANTAEQILALHHDPLALEAIEHFFKLYYWDQSDRWDTQHILQEFHLHQDRDFPFGFGFEKVAKVFRLIQDAGKPVIVPWGRGGGALCEQLRFGGPLPDRDLLRHLQRFTVQIPERVWDRHLGRSIELIHDRFPLLMSPEIHYSERIGLTLDDGQMPFLEV